MRPIRSSWVRPLLLAGTALAGATALIGWLHTASGLRVLSALGVPCPITNVSAAQVVAGHEKGLAAMRGTTPAPLRSALGLALDKTTELEALAWATSKKLHCESLVRGLHYLRCRGVPSDAMGVAGPDISEMWLSFSPSSKLTGLNVYRRGLSASDMDMVWRHSTSRLRTELGSPSTQFGDPSAASLLRSDLSTARVQYRFSNYLATVTAANLSYAGLSVREQYVSATSQN